MNTKVHFSSATPEWSTPQDFFDKLNDEFHFTLDVCATHENHKCAGYLTKEMDALTFDWTSFGHKFLWMNPPYGREIGKWIKKAYESSLSLSGATVVCLIPARTDTRYFHDYCIPFGEIRFIKGRLKFGGCKNSAPFPSCVVIFRGK